MLSLRQSLILIGKQPPIRIPGDVPIPCKSLRDTLITWNHLPYQLLIITPQEFVESVRPLADHKNRTGIATKIISLEHIYQAYPGRDEAEKVKHCLALFQPNNYVRYAMLVGDVDRFPVRFTKWWLDRGPEFHTIFVPGDLYYATLFKKDGSFDDWDGNKDGYFGNVPVHWDDQEGSGTGPINPDDVNAISCLAVGRVPASSKDQVMVYVQKVIAYEKGAFSSSWAKAALFVAGDWLDDGPEKLDYIASNYLQGYNVHKLYYQRDGTESPDPKKINAYMNPPEGVNFVAYIGHGSQNGWAIGNGLVYANYGGGGLDDLTNLDRLPVVFASSCNTGGFAAQPPRKPYLDINGNDHKGTNDGEIFYFTPPQPACIQTIDVESMAEGMTVLRNTGAIAYIGCTNGAWLGGPELLKFFFKALAPGEKTLGDMWLYMLQTYYMNRIPPDPTQPANEVNTESYAYIVEPWHLCLFGDPSLRVGGIPS
jgi:hypothetical protein